MQSDSERVSICVPEFEWMEVWIKLSEENGVCRRCGGMYGGLKEQNLSGVLRWTYSVGGVCQGNLQAKRRWGL